MANGAVRILWCPILRTNADILSQNSTSVIFHCPRPAEVLDGYPVLTCAQRTWDHPAPLCRNIGGLSEWDITLVFGIVGAAAGLMSIIIFIGLIYMACYRKDRRNRYKNDIMAMDVRNGGGPPMEEDIYYPPGYANPGAAFNSGYVHDRSLQRAIPMTDIARASMYEPETMTKGPVSWQYRVDNSQMSIPRPVVGRAHIYSAGESSTDWEYGSHPTLTYAEAERSREIM